MNEDTRTDDAEKSIRQDLREVLKFLKRSFAYLLRLRRPVTTVLVGGVFTIPLLYVPVSWGQLTIVQGGTLYLALVVLSSPAFGYWLRVIQRVGTGDRTPPVFENWKSRVVVGVKVGSIVVLYTLFSTDILSSSGGLVTTLLRRFLEDAVGERMAATVVLFLVLQWIYPAAVLNFARRERLRDVIAFSDIWPILGDRRYLRGVVAWIVTGLVIYVTGFVLARLYLGALGLSVELDLGPRVGLVYFLALNLAGGTTGFLITVASNHIMGDIYSALELSG